jgi:hypothetical protein
MKKIILIAASLIFLICSCHIIPSNTDHPYKEKRTRYYDKKGHYSGYSIKNDYTGKTRYYDKKGRYIGYSK